jgi:hypothetical protein
MKSTSHRSWLKRVSDYQSGDVSATERQSVKTHLQSCPICQEAFADYQRFYTLAASPFRLDHPVVPQKERIAYMETSSQADNLTIGSIPGPVVARRVLPIIAAALVVALISIVSIGHLRSHLLPSNGCNPQVTIPPNSKLYTISMVSANDGWAIGFTINGSAIGSFFLHYHNCLWSKFGETYNGMALKSISMDTATDGWAVGYTQTPAGNGGENIGRQVALHYAGGVWREVSIPAFVGSHYVGLNPIVHMLSPQSGWMAVSLLSSTNSSLIILRYQQGAWIKMASPPMQASDYLSLAAISPDECFLQGGIANNTTDVIAHYVRGTWTTWTASSDVILSNITATQTGQVWAFGSQRFGNDPLHPLSEQPYLLRFDGQMWRTVPMSLAPNVNASKSSAGDFLVMISATEGWMVLTGDNQEYILHLRHGQWQPELRVAGETVFYTLQIVSPTEGWAITQYIGENAPFATTLYHYDGKHWQIVGS